LRGRPSSSPRTVSHEPEYSRAARSVGDREAVRDLTAHRALGLRLNLSEQPEVAIVAVTHALAAQIFYLAADAHVVGINSVNTALASDAEGIEAPIYAPLVKGEGDDSYTLIWSRRSGD
jgi:hypothetical protein